MERKQVIASCPTPLSLIYGVLEGKKNLSVEQEAKFLQLEDEARMKDNGEKGTGQDTKTGHEFGWGDVKWRSLHP